MSENSAPPKGSTGGLRARRALGEIVIIVFGVLAAVALIATGDINLIRDDSVRIGAIRYQGQLRADLTEFGRKLESFQSFESRLFQLLESARPADAQPDSDDTPGSLIALRNNPEARAVFRSVPMNTEARVWYLNQMLTATKDLLGRLQTDVAAGS